MGMFTLFSSCKSEIIANLIDSRVIIKAEPKFTITAKRSGVTLDVSTDYINIGETIELSVYDDANGKAITNGVDVTYSLSGGAGIVKEYSGGRASFQPISRGYGSVLVSYDGGEKVITFLVNSVANPTSMSLGSTPDSLTRTPNLNWGVFNGASVEVAIYREDNDALVENWQTISNGGSVDSTNLNNFNEYYFMVRGVEVSSDKTIPEKVGPWHVNKLTEVTTYVRPELTRVHDMAYARSKYYALPTPTYNTSAPIYSTSSLSSAFSSEGNLVYAQSLLDHMGEVYAFGQGYVWRGDGSTVNLTNGEYGTFKPSISDGQIFTGGSTGSNSGNRYYSIDVSTFTLSNDVRDLETGDGRGHSTRVFNGGVYYSGETHNNTGNPIHVHRGNTSDPTTVTSTSLINVGIDAPDNSQYHAIMEEIDEEYLLVAVVNTNNYTYTTDGTTWSAQTLGATERIRHVLSDSQGFFFLIEDSADDSHYVKKAFTDDMNNPVTIYNIANGLDIDRMQFLESDKLFIFGSNSSNEGYIEVLEHVFDRPSNL